MKKTNHPLIDQEGVCRLVFEQSPDALILQDPGSGLVLHCNEATVKLFGLKRHSTLVGKKGIRYQVSVFRDKKNKQIDRQIKKESKWQGEIQYKTSKGKLFWADVVMTYISTAKGDLLLTRIIDKTLSKELEFRLRKSEEEWSKVMQNMSDSFLVVDRKCRILLINRLSDGFTEEDVIGKPTYNFVPHNYRNLVKEKTEYVFKTGKPASYETNVITPKGEVLWYKSRLAPNFEGKKVVNVSVIASNVTEEKKVEQVRNRAEVAEAINIQLIKEIRERKRIQRELKESQDLVESMINSSQDIIIALDNERRIMRFNNAAEKVYDYKEKEVIGKHISLLAAEPDFVEKIRDHLQNNKSGTFEIISKRKSGEHFPLYLSTSMLLDKEGNRLGSISVARDITRIKKHEEELRLSEKRYRDLVEKSQMLICTHDIRGKILSVNQISRQWTGYTPREMVGKSVRDLLSPKYRKDFKYYLSEVRTKKSASGIMRIVTRHGKERFWSYKNTLQNGEEKPYVTAYVEDVTDYIDAQRQIKDSLKEKEVLLREVHHRVKNNLQVISSILNLQSSYIDDHQTLNILRESQNRIKAMAYIHESLYQAENLSKINFSEYVSNLSDNLKRSYGIVDDSIEIKLNVGNVLLNLDVAIPCGLIIHELVSNSLKYAFPEGKKGKVEVTLKTNNNKAVLTVEDNGIGLPDEVDYKNTRSLGLQLVTALADQLGGKLQVSLKKGTRFSIAFGYNK